MVKLYGFSLLSLLAIDMIAVLVPFADGLNATTRLEFPDAAIVAAGDVVTEKSPGFAPENVIAPIVKGNVPVFCMLKVWFIGDPVPVLPKSVLSPACGVVSPSIIVFVKPVMFISG